MAEPQEPDGDAGTTVAESGLAAAPGRASADRSARGRLRLGHGRRVQLWALVATLPGLGLAATLAVVELPPTSALALAAAALGLSLALTARVRRLVIRPLESLSNLVAGIREGDFSFRARGAGERDALGLTLREINTLADALRTQRLGALEATALLRKVMDEIDVAVFAFDDERQLQLSNPAGERLLGRPRERAIGRRASELGLAEVLAGDPGPRVVVLDATTSASRYQLRRGTFRQGGRPMTLVVLSDLSQALRDEEREAWRRLIRVISHEINNSLAPIASLAESLQRLVASDPRPPDADGDLREGLTIIEDRAQSLSRFMSSYAQLARLPPPTRRPLDLPELVARVAGLELGVAVEVRPGPEVELDADRDQLEQLLINLLRNAAEALAELHPELAAAPAIELSWAVDEGAVELWIDDRGPGVSEATNLFVPFYSTKPGGSGIGLALSRQIAEGHGGSLILRPRDGGGCRAVVRLARTGPSEDRGSPTKGPGLRSSDGGL